MSASVQLNEKDRACFILNPRSAGGATADRQAAFHEAASRHFSNFEIWRTERPGHATELAARAAQEGFTLVGAVGGDGTASEVVNGLMGEEKARNPATVFTVVPAGTGSDLIKTLRSPRELDAALWAAAHGEDRPSDLVQLDVTAQDRSKSIRRWGVNVTGFGVSGAVVQYANESRKLFGGKVTFALAAVRALMDRRWGPIVAQWKDAAGESHGWEGDVVVGFIGNGQYCGGGMWVGPGGSMQDGLLELLILPRMRTRDLLRNAPRLYDGTLGEAPGVVRTTVRSLELMSPEKNFCGMDVDGEQPGVLPLKAAAIEKALVIRGIWK